MNICFIPARGGSKRIPRKNIKHFRGEPMISWSIKAALDSNCFEKIIVSTDDQEIADISSLLGAEVPFKRPQDLSNDYATTQEVILHGINWLEKYKLDADLICCIYATAPFIQSEEIKKGMKMCSENKSESFVFSATTFDFPIQRAIKIDKNGLSYMLNPKNYIKRSQDLEEYYHDAGQFYIGSKNTWKNKFSFFEKGKPLLLPRWRVQDIDNQEDWIRAEKLHQILFL